MPRHPHFSPSVEDIADSVYSGAGPPARHLQRGGLSPPRGGYLDGAGGGVPHGGPARRGVPGHAPLRPAAGDAGAARRHRRAGARAHGGATERENVLVATGATGALGAVAGAILAPGDEVLQLAPHWPLITGIIRSFHGVPVDVPFFGAADSPETAVEAVRAQLTDAHRRPLPQHSEQPGRPGHPALLDRGAGRVGRRARTCGSSPTRSTRTTSSRASTPIPGRWRPSAPSPPTPSPRPTAWRATAAATWSGPAPAVPRAAQDRHAQLLQHADRLPARRPARAARPRGRLDRRSPGAVPAATGAQGGRPPRDCRRR